MNYSASWDNTTKALTLFVIGLMTFIAYMGRNQQGWALVLQCILPAVILAGSYLFAPRSYSIEAGKLLIHRPIGVKSIDISSVTDVRELDKTELKGLIRTFGNGGLFGFYGRFYSPRLGAHRWFASRASRLVAIITTGGTIVVSPDAAADFVARLATH